MSVRHFRSRLRVDHPIDEVFAFFERPENLERITPPWMGMRILSADRVMREGLEIDYAITPFPHVPARWRSKITAYDPPHSFTDVQVRGPYARWEHSHRFRPDGDATIVEDDVTYEVPFGLLGDLVGPVLVRPRLRGIFAYRSAAIRRLLPDRAANADSGTVVEDPGVTSSRIRVLRRSVGLARRAAKPFRSRVSAIPVIVGRVHPAASAGSRACGPLPQAA